MTIATSPPEDGRQAVAATSAPERDASVYTLSPDLVTLVQDRQAEAEAIRTVRTHIIARHIEDGRRGLAVCAPTAGVGCTSVAVNLAIALAQVGVRTLLIDGDLRAPKVDSFITPSASAVGLRQCIAAGGSPSSEFIREEVIPNLAVLFAGGEAPDAQELLAGEAFRRLIERCLRDFEFTIIDTPPTSVCADGLRVSTMMGYALVVAKANVTMMNQLSTLAADLQEDGAQVVGTVLVEA